jgi:hypothetical protein
MELKTIIGFIIALVWMFLRNYEQKARPQPPIPVPEPVNKPVFDGDAFPKSAPNTRHKLNSAKKNINKISPVRAAYSEPVVSISKKGGTAPEITETGGIDEQINEFAEEIRYKLQSPAGAREAFIYNEIFKQRV